MYSSYRYPYYRSAMMYPYPYPVWGNPYGYGYGYGYNGTNLYGSAVANNSLVNTGSMIGVNQTATPTVIW